MDITLRVTDALRGNSFTALLADSAGGDDAIEQSRRPTVEMAGGRGSLAADSDDEDDGSAPPQIRALPDGAENVCAQSSRAQLAGVDERRHSSRPALSSTETTAKSIPMMMCPWAFGGCGRSRRWGRRWCGRGLFWVLWSSCALYSPLAPLASSESSPLSRWAVGQRL